MCVRLPLKRMVRRVVAKHVLTTNRRQNSSIALPGQRMLGDGIVCLVLAGIEVLLSGK